jgi:rhodanese-related sulfurtransferase
MGKEAPMAEPARVSPADIYQKVKDGKILLVCGYEDDAKFKLMHLEGAISLSDFKARLASLSKDQDIVFYCA